VAFCSRSSAGMNPCEVKGCPWRGSDPHECPMHSPEGRQADDEAWDSVHGYARYRGHER